MPECLILHHADDLDAKLEMYVRCLSRDQATGLAEGWVAYTYGESFAITDDTTAMAHYERAVQLGQRAGEPVSRERVALSAGSLRARLARSVRRSTRSPHW